MITTILALSLIGQFPAAQPLGADFAYPPPRPIHAANASYTGLLPCVAVRFTVVPFRPLPYAPSTLDPFAGTIPDEYGFSSDPNWAYVTDGAPISGFPQPLAN